MRQAGHIVERIAERDRRLQGANRHQAHRRVAHEDPRGFFDQQREVSAVETMNAAGDAELFRQVVCDARPRDLPGIEWMELDQEVSRGRSLLREGADDLLQEDLLVLVVGILADLIVRLQLQRHQIERMRAGVVVGEPGSRCLFVEPATKRVSEARQILEGREPDPPAAIERIIDRAILVHEVEQHFKGQLRRGLVGLETLGRLWSAAPGDGVDRGGIIREMRPYAHTATLKRQPARAEIAELHCQRLDAHLIRHLLRNGMIGKPVGEVDDMSDVLAADQVAQEIGPALPAAAIVDRALAAPEQPVRRAQVNAQRPRAGVLEGICQFVPERGRGPLQEKDRAFSGCAETRRHFEPLKLNREALLSPGAPERKP